MCICIVKQIQNPNIFSGAINIKPAAAIGQPGAVPKADGTISSPTAGTVVRGICVVFRIIAM